MIKILFVCHGNICRSPMAEFMFKEYVKKRGVMEKFHIASCATSREEIGNPVHYGTKRILTSLGIDCSSKRAIQLKKEDYNTYDFILAMDKNNIHNILSIIGKDAENKVHLLLEYTDLCRDIRDPWWTNNFEETFEDIKMGIQGFYSYLLREGFLKETC